MYLKPITNKKTWNDFITLDKFPFYSFLWSWEWLDFKEDFWFPTLRFGIYDKDNNLIWLFPLIKTKAKRWTYLFAPHSPLITVESNASQMNSEKWRVNNKSNSETISESPDHKTILNQVQHKDSGWQTPVKSGKWKVESSQPSAGIAKGDNSIPTSSDFSSDLLLKHIDSPIVKWIIKNFWHVELVDGKILITIISETNYKILTQPEKLQELEKAINKIAPNTPFEVIYMSKEEYFNQKLLA